MELRELAERVLLGHSLSDKLAAPAAGQALTDTTPGLRGRVPDAPGRPAALAFRSSRDLVPFPHANRLGHPAAAGAALHTFANHELLALELMALALLRFPDADPRFRRELAATMRDEQRHLALYIERMAELGVAFGDHATSPFFWDCLAGVDSVDGFVAGMSLTLEQANLDFAVEYAGAFRAVGDDRTASLLERVHREEVVHVARGVQHFGRSQPAEPLWDLFVRHLPAPLTPRRARGRTVDRPSRRKAGLPDSFVDRVAVYAHSRGRRPRLYIWNPACEDEIAHGAGHVRRGLIADLEHDLATLPALLASEDDAVLVPTPPRADWLRHLSGSGLRLPRFVTPEESADLEVDEVIPWGRSPRFEGWTDDLASLFDKRAAGRWLRTVHPELQDASNGRLVASDALPRIAKGPEAAWQIAQELREQGYPHVVFKQGLGASGRGQLRLLHEPEPTTAQWGWLRRNGTRVRVEPWLERRLDLSLHFDARNGALVPRGTVRFATDRTGRFLHASIGSPTAGLPTPLARFLAGDGRDARWLDRVITALGRELGPIVAVTGYEGPVGIDAMVAMDPRTSHLVLHPMLEMNPRWTFGRLALRLRGRRTGRGDRLRLVAPAAAKQLVGTGAVALNDPETARRVVAVWER